MVVLLAALIVFFLALSLSASVEIDVRLRVKPLRKTSGVLQQMGRRCGAVSRLPSNQLYEARQPGPHDARELYEERMRWTSCWVSLIELIWPFTVDT